MVSRCNVCMGFKKSRKSKCKKCSHTRGQRGRGIATFFKKAKRLTKKAISSDIGKFVISPWLAYAPNYWIKKKMLQKGTDHIYSKL